MSITTEWVNELKWSRIFDRDEHGNDGELLFSEITEEAPYRGGYLVRDTFIDYTQGKESGVRTSSITFVLHFLKGTEQ